jgi:hypothetical protein
MPRYSAFAPFIASVLAKRFFLAKILYTYTMNYLRQEITLRDHEARQGEFSLNCRTLELWSETRGYSNVAD